MQLVQVTAGRLELRWTWLPWWLAQSSATEKISDELRDVALLNAATTSPEDITALSNWVRRRYLAKFPDFTELRDLL